MENIEKDVLKELYEEYNWPDIDSSKKEDKIYGVDMASSPSFKSSFTIYNGSSIQELGIPNTSIRGIVAESKAGPKNEVELFDKIANLANYLKL